MATLVTRVSKVLFALHRKTVSMTTQITLICRKRLYCKKLFSGGISTKICLTRTFASIWPILGLNFLVLLLSCIFLLIKILFLFLPTSILFNSSLLIWLID